MLHTLGGTYTIARLETDHRPSASQRLLLVGRYPISMARFLFCGRSSSSQVTTVGQTRPLAFRTVCVSTLEARASTVDVLIARGRRLGGLDALLGFYPSRGAHPPLARSRRVPRYDVCDIVIAYLTRPFAEELCSSDVACAERSAGATAMRLSARITISDAGYRCAIKAQELRRTCTVLPCPDGGCAFRVTRESFGRTRQSRCLYERPHHIHLGARELRCGSGKAASFIYVIKPCPSSTSLSMSSA